MIEFELPIKVDTANKTLSQHWSKRHKKSKTNGNGLRFVLNTQPLSPQLPCCVTLTRIAPRALDEDNLIGGMKNIRDYIADWLIPGLQAGRADSDKRITWNYSQEKRKPKEYALKVRIDHVGWHNSSTPICWNFVKITTWMHKLRRTKEIFRTLWFPILPYLPRMDRS